MRACRAACSACASAARAALIRRRRMATPATTSAWRRPRCGRQWRGIETREQALGLVEAADQQEVAGLEVARMRGIGTVAVPFERVTWPHRAPLPAS